MAAKDLSFPFMGGTMAGQNVTECSGCFCMVLSGSIDLHRAWHAEQERGQLPSLYASDSPLMDRIAAEQPEPGDDVPDMAGEERDSVVVRREGADGPVGDGPVGDGLDDGVTASGDGETEVVDPQDAQRDPGKPVRGAAKARRAVK